MTRLHRRATALAVVLLVAATPLAATPLAAQERVRIILSPGTEVRLTPRPSAGEPTVGRADGIVGDTLVLATPARRIALADLSVLEVRAGRDRARGATVGGAILGAVTGVAGGVDYGRGNITLGDYATSTLGNIALGAALGYLFAPTGWTRLPLPSR